MIRSVATPPRLYATATRPAAPTVARAAVVTGRGAEPTGSGFSLGGMGGHIKTAGSLAQLYNGFKTAMDGGRALKPDATRIIKSVKGLKGNGLLNSVKGVVTGALPFAQRSAVFAGAISIVTNGVNLAQGRISFGTFGSRVVGDIIGGFAGGAGGAIGGAVGLALLGTFGITGMVATIGGIAAGFGGYMMAENMVRRTGLFKTVTGTIKNAMGG